ncbi:MAG: single-stranded-DNA-specific exonuclease RecJ [Patescibacteria group bacterium]
MKRWQIAPQMPAGLRLERPDLDPVILQLLFNRGLATASDIQAFFADAAYHDPFLFKHMAAAVDLIIAHIKAGDKIVVYGDYDADGVTSAVILLETLNILHGKAEVYLPDRVSEGYGLNRAAIDQIAARSFKLLITVDNGIRNKAEVVYAQGLGLDIIITDHHVLPESEADLPPCPYINPADPRDNYPWKLLAGVGVSFKLISALLAKADLPDKQKKMISEKCLDLVAIGTVSDMVSLLGENRQLVKHGLEILNQYKRLGLNELIKVAKINSGRKLEAWNIGWQIGPRLNAASRLAHANSAFSLLTTTDPSEAKELAGELNQRNISRQQITEEIAAAVEAQIDPQNLPLVIFGVAGPDQVWNEGVVGLVAGRIAEKYYRPTLIVARLVEEAEFDPATKKLAAKKVAFKGSGRSVEEFNLIAAVEEGAEFLDKYGGHPMACGFSIKTEENLRAFQAKLLALAAASLDPAALVPKLQIEAELPAADINLSLAESINSLAPFGQNNPQPRLVSYALRIDDIVTMGLDNQHIKFRLSAADPAAGTMASVWALAFGAAQNYQGFRIGDQVDLVYYLEINDFNGRREPQLKIVDIKRHGG